MSRMATIGLQKFNSCPDLTMYRIPEEDDEAHNRRRYKRAFSECQYADGGTDGASGNQGDSLVSIIRAHSDSDLRKIDRKRTFAGINHVEPNDLLAKVASALGQLRPTDDEEDERMQGVHGFTDSQILASERTWGGWSNVNGGGRMRAASETKLPNERSNDDAYEWTWSGANDQINDLRKLRQKSRYNDLYRASFGAAQKRRRRPSEGFSNATVIAMPPSSQETTITSGQNRFMGRFNNIFRKRAMSTSSGMMQQLPSNIHEDAIKYLKATSGDSRYPSLSAGPGAAPGYSRRGSIYESLQSENSQILENTTIADLIKVLEAVHTQATLQDDHPRRKLGTASLTPPAIPSIFGLFDPTPDVSTYETYNPRFDRRGSMFPSLNNFPTSSRRASLMPTTLTGKPQPPPYSSLEVPLPASVAAVNSKRRFSVRPTPLNYSSQGNTSSVTSLASNSSASQVPPVTRRMSLRPSPLARDPVASSSFRDTSRFAKPKSLQREVISHNARQRHGSLSNLPERPLEKKRYDSK